MGRGRKVEMGRKIKMGPKEMKERHDLAMAKYYESLNKSEVILYNLSSTDEICFFFNHACMDPNCPSC